MIAMLKAPQYKDSCPECGKALGSASYMHVCVHVSRGSRKMYVAHPACCSQCHPRATDSMAGAPVPAVDPSRSTPNKALAVRSPTPEGPQT